MSDAAVKERQFAVKEIIQTETNYVEKLIALQQVFIEPLLARRHVYAIANDPRFSIFLSSISQIVQLNTEFLNEIKAASTCVQESPTADLTVFTEVLLKYGKLFSCYGQFSKYFDISKFIIESSKDSDPKFKAFLEEVENDPRFKRQSLEAMLIKPIQRPPQYLLFLKQLIKASHPSDPATSLLLSAEVDFKASVEAVNDSIKNKENVEMLFQLEEKFRGQIILFSVSRKLIKVGKLHKVCRSYEKKYIFHLFNDLLLYSSESTTGFILHRKLDLIKTRFSDLPDSKKRSFAFQIVSNSKSFVVRAESAVEKEEWLSTIMQSREHLIQDSYRESKSATVKKRSKATSDDTRELAPVWKEDSEASHCMICKTNFTLFNRKHHCRSCGQICCNSCSLQRRVLPNISESHPVRVCDDCVAKVDGSNVEVTSRDSLSPRDLSEEEVDEKFIDDPRYQKVLSLIEAERTYVESLNVLDDFFIKPLLEVSLTQGHKSDRKGEADVEISSGAIIKVPAKVLTGELSTFFSQVGTIATLNGEFLEDLESRLDSWNESEVVGDLFIQYGSLFRLYGEFAKGNSLAIPLLSSDSPLAEYRAKVEALKEMNGSSISSLLSEPLKRIPLYEIQLRQLLSVTPSTHRDYDLLEKSCKQLIETLDFINETIKKDSNMAKIRDLEQNFTKEMHLASPGRMLLKTGFLTKVNRTGQSSRYVFHLFSDILLYSSQTASGKLEHHNTLELSSVQIEDEKEDKVFPNSFRILSSKKSFVVMADNELDKTSWMNGINDALEKIKSPSESSAQAAPIWKPDDQSTSCGLCGGIFSIFNRKHHCRNWYESTRVLC